MDISIAFFLGQSAGLAIMTYPFSAWGAKHPASLAPLSGVRGLLFLQIFACATAITALQIIVNVAAPTDIWAVVSLIVCIFVGRILRDRLIKNKFDKMQASQQ